MAYVQKNHPFSVTSCGRRRSFQTTSTPKRLMEDESPMLRRKSNEPRKTTKGKGRNFRTVKEGAGMTAKGVAAYRRKNPGSKLQTAVTGKVKPGSKAAKRRKSFCARSAGQMKKFPKAAKNPNSRLRQARRRWRC